MRSSTLACYDLLNVVRDGHDHTIRAVKVELEGYLTEKTKLSRDRVLCSLIKATAVVTD